MNEQDSKKIFDVFQNLKSLQKVTTGIDFQKAKALAYMKKNKNYQTIIGDPEASWRSFIAQPELQPLKVATADRLVKIYSTYIEILGLKEEDVSGIDSNSLYRLSTVVDKLNVDEWLEKARLLSRADLYKEIKFGNVDEMKCEHMWKSKEVKTCKKCGAREVTKK